MSVKTANQFHIEEDASGNVQVPAEHLWGAQTQRSHMNFPIGVERFHWGRPLIQRSQYTRTMTSTTASRQMTRFLRECTSRQ